MSLSSQQQRVVIDQLDTISKKDAKKSDFSSSRKAQREIIWNDLLDQKGYHREQLLKFIEWMTVASFSLLAIIVLMQMIIRIWNTGYSGVSDSVVKVLTVGVFGQIIGVVASIVVEVWKDQA